MQMKNLKKEMDLKDKAELEARKKAYATAKIRLAVEKEATLKQHYLTAEAQWRDAEEDLEKLLSIPIEEFEMPKTYSLTMPRDMLWCVPGCPEGKTVTFEGVFDPE